MYAVRFGASPAEIEEPGDGTPPRRSVLHNLSLDERAVSTPFPVIRIFYMFLMKYFRCTSIAFDNCADFLGNLAHAGISGYAHGFSLPLIPLSLFDFFYSRKRVEIEVGLT
jgi:hypothetical protein